MIHTDTPLDDLGEIAGEALSGAETQEVLDDTDFTKVRFVGMSFDSLDQGIQIGELVLRVRARCIGVGQEARKSDGAIRNLAKMDVQSVQRFEE